MVELNLGVKKSRIFHIVWKVATLALANMREIKNLPAVIEIAQNRDQTLQFVTKKFEISVVLNPVPSTKLKTSGSL